MATRLYPCTLDTTTLCKLAGVPEETWTLYRRFRNFVNDRKDGAGNYVPYLDEVEIGEITQAANEYGPECREILVTMPDGEVVFGNGSQGETPDDAGYLLYKWKIEFYPNVHKLEDFLLFGWGRVELPPYMGDSACGETHDLDEVRDILDEMGIDLGEVHISDLKGMYWS